MKKTNSSMILNFQCCLVNNYLEKGFYIIERYPKQNSMLINDVKLGINVIDQMDTYFVMAKKIASVATNIKNYIFRTICILFTNKSSIRIKKGKIRTFY